MKKFAIIYWSGTGNTQKMAEKIENELSKSGIVVNLFKATEFNSSLIGDYDGLALGCPAMGAEQLEETEFEPMFLEIKDFLSNKNIALFGSYAWGDGEWMRNWHKECENAGANIVCNPVIVNGTPDADCFSKLEKLSQALIA